MYPPALRSLILSQISLLAVFLPQHREGRRICREPVSFVTIRQAPGSTSSRLRSAVDRPIRAFIAARTTNASRLLPPFFRVSCPYSTHSWVFGLITRIRRAATRLKGRKVKRCLLVSTRQRSRSPKPLTKVLMVHREQWVCDLRTKASSRIGSPRNARRGTMCNWVRRRSKKDFSLKR